MNLSELKTEVDRAIESAIEYGEAPEEVTVSIQVDVNRESPWSDDVELIYDNDCQASGCVLVGDAAAGRRWQLEGKIVVVAGHRQQFQYWIRQNVIPITSKRDLERLRGIEIAGVFYEGDYYRWARGEGEDYLNAILEAKNCLRTR